MQVVADTSALIALATCKALPLLDKLFDRVLVPPAVYEEATVQEKLKAQALQNFLNDKIEQIDLTRLVIAARGRCEYGLATCYTRRITRGIS